MGQRCLFWSQSAKTFIFYLFFILSLLLMWLRRNLLRIWQRKVEAESSAAPSRFIFISVWGTWLKSLGRNVSKLLLTVFRRFCRTRRFVMFYIGISGTWAFGVPSPQMWKLFWPLDFFVQLVLFKLVVWSCVTVPVSVLVTLQESSDAQNCH